MNRANPVVPDSKAASNKIARVQERERQQRERQKKGGGGANRVVAVAVNRAAVSKAAADKTGCIGRPAAEVCLAAFCASRLSHQSLGTSYRWDG